VGVDEHEIALTLVLSRSQERKQNLIAAQTALFALPHETQTDQRHSGGRQVHDLKTLVHQIKSRAERQGADADAEIVKKLKLRKRLTAPRRTAMVDYQSH
jgi:hypothetical protein